MNLELKNKRDLFKQQFKKRCFIFSLNVLKLSETLRERRNNWILLDQLIRSGTSIGANIVEGGNSTSKKEFINYFQIALKSSSETLYWLALLKEINKDQVRRIEPLINECSEIKKMLTTIILNTKSNSRF
jgi:four helix bundle protein